MPNLALALRETAAMYPDHPAVRLDATSLSYAELDQASARVARLLGREGFQPGDRVGVMLPNVPEFAVIYPRRVWLLDSLPKGPTGKIMRRLVVAHEEASTSDPAHRRRPGRLRRRT